MIAAQYPNHLGGSQRGVCHKAFRSVTPGRLASVEQEIGATVVTGGFWKPDTVVLQIDGGSIILDHYTQSVPAGETAAPIPYARVRTLHSTPFRFAIYPESFGSSVAKLFGMQDIKIARETFDERFVVRSNDADRIQRLLAHDSLCALLEAQKNDFRFELDDVGLKIDVCADVRDVQRLKQMFGLVSLTLTVLAQGSELAPQANRDGRQEPPIPIGTPPPL